MIIIFSLIDRGKRHNRVLIDRQTQRKSEGKNIVEKSVDEAKAIICYSPVLKKLFIKNRRYLVWRMCA